jgi:hypothetical protein
MPDGGQDPFHAADCGEECAAMRIWYRTGIALPAGILRQLIPGHSDHGETSPEELVVLMRVFGLRPVVMPTTVDAVQGSLTDAVRKGIPPIVLGYWESRTVLHYILGVDADAAGFLANDPWGGKRGKLSWDQVASGYAGWCIL